eukprot:SAG11_NODE_802_length_7105_cov_1.831573_9_plen_57_part_00
MTSCFIISIASISMWLSIGSVSSVRGHTNTCACTYKSRSAPKPPILVPSELLAAGG